MDVGRLTSMAQAGELLDRQLSNLGRAVLRSGGSVAMSEASAHAEREYGKYKEAQKRLRHERADRDIAAIKAAEQRLGKPRR